METYEKKQRLERERTVESKEKHEEEMTEEVKAAATRERAEYLVKEVKNNTQQVQNIMIHMQTVLRTLHALENQLQLANSTDPSSIQQDKRQVEKLKQKIIEHKEELRGMKGDLIAILESEKTTNKNGEQTQKKARVIIEEIIQELGV